jgi:hypothetical protein
VVGRDQAGELSETFGHVEVRGDQLTLAVHVSSQIDTRLHRIADELQQCIPVPVDVRRTFVADRL